MSGYPSIHRCVATIIIVTGGGENGSHDLRQTNQAIPNNTIPISTAEMMRRRVLVFPAAELLGTFYPHPERLCKGKHSNAARGEGGRRDASADPLLFSAPAGVDDNFVLHTRHGPFIW
jgi:hypothetical protein